MFKKNDIIPLTIESITNEGSGIGHTDGIAVFVPMTASGDELRVRIVKVQKSYCYGIIEEVITPSPDRVPVDCPSYKRCGGCSLRHITYEAELREKQRWVQDAMRRIGGFTMEPLPILPSPSHTCYRNKAQFPFGQGDAGSYTGFFAPRSHTVIPCRDCPLQPVVFSEIAAWMCHYADTHGLTIYNEQTGKGLLRHLYLRQAAVDGSIMLCLIINGDKMPHAEEFTREAQQQFPAISTILLNHNTIRDNVILGQQETVLAGPGTLQDVLCGVSVTLSPHSFYQVNHDAAEQLYREAAQLAALHPNETLLDLYCGAGTIGLSMVQPGQKLIGVEVVHSAVENARQNAVRAGVTDAEFLCADAGKASQILAERGLRPDVIVLDPPRKGCDNDTLQAVVHMAPSRIVMVSCNPATMARDAAILREMGYDLQCYRPVDLFPRTAHCETVCQLVLRKPAVHINIDVDVEELVQDKRGAATYGQIKDYVLEHSGLKVSSLYIAQVKQKYGIIERENYNKTKSENVKQPQCPPEKEKAITEALKHFGMI